ncbi:MAG: hypothetical protein ABFD69_10150 [Candidatus Sumerlaeia bacterium]
MLHKALFTMTYQRLLGVAALLIMALTTGCATSVVTSRIGPEGERIMFKRYERNLARDYMHHFTRDIYDAPGVYDVKAGAGDQAIVAEDHGAPDFVRAFRSMTGERVREWIYTDQALIFQFIGDELVFTGPLTHLEQILMSYGRPDFYDFFASDITGQSIDLLYTGTFGTRRLENFKLNNDKITLRSEGN